MGYPADILARAARERNTVDGDKLGERVANSQALGDASASSAHRIEFILPADKNRSARKVCQTIYAQRVMLPVSAFSKAVLIRTIKYPDQFW